MTVVGGLGRCAAVLGGAALAIVLLSPPVAAHAELASSSPSAGAELAAAPRFAELHFTEDIAPRHSVARLLDGAGRPVEGATTDQGDQRSLVLRLPPLRDGTYGVSWRVLAEDDGHTADGVLVFTVGAGSRADALAELAAPASPSPWDVGRRWLGLALLAGLIGGVAVVGIVLGGPSAATYWARRRILRVAAASAALGALVGGLDLAAAAGRSGVVGELVTGTHWGQLWLAREALLLATAVLLSRAARTTRRWPVLPVVTPLVLAVVAAEALASHVAALGAAAVTAVGLHILTASTWLGSLAALGLALWGRGVGPADRRALIRACRGRFSVLAAVSVSLAALTGLYSAGRQVDVAGALATTPYGQALLVKAGLVLVVCGLGLANAARLHDWAPCVVRTRWPLSRPLLLAELAVGALVLLTAGVLAESGPPRTLPPPAPPSAAATRTAVVGDLVVTVSVTPNRPGVNAFTVVVASSRRPPPAPVRHLTLTIDRPTGVVPVQEVAPGRYFGTARLTEAADVPLTAVIQRGEERVTVPVSLRLSPAPRRAPGRPLAPIADVLALLVALAGAVTGWMVIRAARRPAPQADAPPVDARQRVATR